MEIQHRRMRGGADRPASRRRTQPWFVLLLMLLARIPLSNRKYGEKQPQWVFREGHPLVHLLPTVMSHVAFGFSHASSVVGILTAMVVFRFELGATRRVTAVPLLPERPAAGGDLYCFFYIHPQNRQPTQLPRRTLTIRISQVGNNFSCFPRPIITLSEQASSDSPLHTLPRRGSVLPQPFAPGVIQKGPCTALTRTSSSNRESMNAGVTGGSYVVRRSPNDDLDDCPGGYLSLLFGTLAPTWGSRLSSLPRGSQSLRHHTPPVAMSRNTNLPFAYLASLRTCPDRKPGDTTHSRGALDLTLSWIAHEVTHSP